MEFVYLLWHTHLSGKLEGGEDIKLIGTYSSTANAEAAQLRTALLEGFKDSIEGFEISSNIIDKDEWTSGFITA